jgi:glycogen synthase
LTNIIFVTYEVPWFRCGGIAAVMQRLPRAAASDSRSPVAVIAPFHVSSHDNNKIPSLELKLVARIACQIPIFGEDVSFSIERYTQSSENVFWYFLKASDDNAREQLFGGHRHPYDLPSPQLRRDAVIFGQAAVNCLQVISSDLRHDDEPWKILLQDWEAATAALAFSSETPYGATLYLTLHNSYDSYIGDDELLALGVDPTRCRGTTILDRALKLVHKPVFTVSDQFAVDLTGDLLQTRIIAPHLQTALNADPVIGIDNGPFETLQVPKDVFNALVAGDFEPIAEWKMAEKQRALELFRKPLPEGVEWWGDKDAFAKRDCPWIVMAGRDDPRQKGYDVAAAAIELYLKERRQDDQLAQFLFFPILGDEGVDGLRFLQDLANTYPASVLVFLGIWVAGFSAANRGSVYGLMPSLYEPFGMANEFYLRGCLGMGRATGGNLEQIVPLRASAVFGESVKRRAARFHSLSAKPTGILFRESDGVPTAVADWNAINDAGYAMGNNRVQERSKYHVFNDMARELSLGIGDAVSIYEDSKDQYYQMLTDGIVHIRNAFSWKRCSREYIRQAEASDTQELK